MEGVRGRLAIGSLWTAGIRVFINLLGAANTLVLARLLTPSDFGLVAIATIVFTIVNAFTELSLASALIQHPDPKRKHFDTAWTLNVMRALIVAAILFCSAHVIAIVFGDKRLVLITYALAFTSLVTGMVNPKMVEFRRRLSFHQEMFVELANKLAGLIVAITIAVLFRTYWAIVFGLLAAQLTGTLLSYLLIPYLPRFSLIHWRNLFSFSSWLALSSGFNAINYRADQLIVGGVLGTSSLGQYTVGDNLASLPVRESTTPLSYVLFPAFSKAQDDQPRLRDMYYRAQRLLVAVALPVGVGFALVAEPLVHLVMGPEWSSAALVIQILSTIFALHAFSMPLTPLAMGVARTRMLFKRDVVNLLVRYPLIFAGLFSGGLLGLLLARCVSGLFGVMLDMYLARMLVQASLIRQVRNSARALTATLAMVLTVWGLESLGVDGSNLLEIACLVFAGAITYFGITAMLWLWSGRPAGPEQEAMEMFQFLQRRLQSRHVTADKPEHSNSV